MNKPAHTPHVKPHTALPWHIGMKPGPMIYGQQGEQVADCRGLLEMRESCLDTTYIVHACNAYPALVKALQAILAYEDDRPLPGTKGAEVYAQAETTLSQAEGR